MKTEDYSKASKRQDQDEIDISKLFKQIGKWIAVFFKSIFRLFFLFIDTIYDNLKLIFFIIAAGALLGAAYFFYEKPYYESSMTLSSAHYKGQFIDNSMQNLNALCREKNFKSLAKILSIPVAKAKELKSIEIEPVMSPSMRLLIDLYDETEGNKRRLDSLILNNNDTTYQVKVQVYDTTALSGLDSSLVNYIAQNKFVRKRIEVERTNLRKRRAKLIKESVNLDTLKHNIALSYRNQAGGRTGTNNVILDDKGTNPIDIYREDMRLYEQQLKIDKLLYINSEIEIINPFIAFGAPKSGTVISNILKGVAVGIALVFVVICTKVVLIGINRMRYVLKEED